ncbi:MAG: ABC transporter permease [Candidatus Bathyarchaeota archaeon]|nr:MAG: ABC transporter permease [Candidatus Bathyarchaeota archaeon]
MNDQVKCAHEQDLNVKFFLLFNQLLSFPVSIALGTCSKIGEWKGIVGAAGQVALKTYAVKRLIFLVLAFFFSSTLIFALANLGPSMGPIIPPPRPSPELIELIRELGLDQPLPVQYLMWMGRLLRGNLGYSLLTRRPVWEMISPRILPTVGLVVSAEIVSVAIVAVLGVFAAVKEHSTSDSLASRLALVGNSASSYLIAVVALIVFAGGLRWLPAHGDLNVSRFVLPTIVLAFGWASYLFRIVRSGILEEIQQDYIVDARAKGLRERADIYKRALSDALLPVVKYLGYSVGFMLGGAIVIEYIFSWPGLCQLLVRVADYRDYPAILGVSVIIVAMALVINFCADITHEALKPTNKRLPTRSVPTRNPYKNKVFQR